MFKQKPLLIILTSILLAGFIKTEVFARALTSTERKEYAQNNILFYTPCNTEEDCEPPIQQEPDPSSTPDPSSPDSPPPSSGGDKGDPFTPSGSGATLIVSTARAMAWPTSAGTCRDSFGSYVGWLPTAMDRNASCQDTMSDYLRSIGQTGLIQDCGKFVGLVMRKTVDPNFRASGVRYQIPYMKNSNKWTKVSTDGQMFSMANLKPGDVIAFSESGSGHIMIWLGNQSVPCKRGRCSVNVASSSFRTRSPSLNKISRMQQCNAGGQCFLFQVFRWTGD